MSIRFDYEQYEGGALVASAEFGTPYDPDYGSLARIHIADAQGNENWRDLYDLSIADDRFTIVREASAYRVHAKHGAVFGRDELGEIDIAVTATKAGYETTGIFTFHVTPPGRGDYGDRDYDSVNDVYDNHAAAEHGFRFNSRGTGDGNDKFTVGSRHIYNLHTGDGDDTIIDGNGRASYLIFSGRGDDVFKGGDGGAGYIYGGSGNDKLYGGDDGNYFLHGGSGDDHIYGDGGRDSHLHGGEGNDHIYGGDGNDRKLYGGSGDDKIYGGDGDDFYLYGGSGHDVIDGGNGDDSNIYGWTGNDIFVLSQGDDTIMDFKQGEDKIGIREGFSFNFETDVSGNVISIADGTMTLKGFIGTLTIDDFSYIIEGTESHDTLFGTDGNDVIYGYAGQDHVTTGAGNDRIYGGDGNDVIFAGIGDDYLDGGNGNDLLHGQEDKDIFVLDLTATGKDTVYEFEQGVDKIRIKKPDYDQIAIDGNVIKDADDNDVFVLQGFDGTITREDFAITRQLTHDDVINNLGSVDENDEGADIVGLRFALDGIDDINDLTVVGVFDGDKAVSDKLKVKDYANGMYGLKLKEGESFDYEQRDFIYLRLHHDGEYVGGGTLLIDVNDVFEEVV